MTLFWKASAVLILTVILGAAIGKKEIMIVLSTTACSMIVIMGLRTLSDLIVFLNRISNEVNYESFLSGILLKITGVALVSELTGLISADAGNASLEKAIQFLGNAVALSLALPLFEAFYDIIQELLRVL